MKGIRSLILDVDSTLTTLEGIDWLAAQRGTAIAEYVAGLTDQAMSGMLTLDEVFELRLAAVRPSRNDVEHLAEAYMRSISPGAPEAIEAIQAAGIRIVLVSGGIREAIMPLASMLRIPENDLHAVSLLFDEVGQMVNFDRITPLNRQHGKRMVVEALGLPRPVAAVGDGATDLEMRGAVDCFVAFTGVVRREVVVKQADGSADSFSELRELVLG